VQQHVAGEKRQSVQAPRVRGEISMSQHGPFERPWCQMYTGSRKIIRPARGILEMGHRGVASIAQRALAIGPSVSKRSTFALAATGASSAPRRIADKDCGSASPRKIIEFGVV